MNIVKRGGLYHKVRWYERRMPRVVFIGITAFCIATAAYALTQSYYGRIYVVSNQTIPEKAYLRVAAVGDIACSPDDPNFNNGQGLGNACQSAAVSRAIQKERLDGVLLLGDIQYNSGKLADFERSFVPYWRSITAPMYPVPGNHDYGNGSGGTIEDYSTVFRTYFPAALDDNDDTPGYYVRGLSETWNIIGLNSNCEYVGGCGIDSKQLNWLNDKLRKDSHVCTIAFWHHPVFTSGVHNTAPDTSYGRDFWDSLTAARADIVLNGHDHNFERFAKQLPDGTLSSAGMREFVVGTGGVGLRPVGAAVSSAQEKVFDDQFGYLLLKLYKGWYAWEFKGIDGVVHDSGTDSCIR